MDVFCAVCYHKFAMLDRDPRITDEKDAYSYYKTSAHDHVLTRTFNQSFWYCDGNCGFKANEYNSMKRYTCPNCNFDLCEICFNAKKLS